MRLRTYLCICILVGLVLSLIYLREPISHKALNRSNTLTEDVTTVTNQPGSINSVISSDRVSTALHSQLATVATATSSRSTQPDKYHGQPIGSVFADLDAPPSDWREFNPELLNLVLPDGKTVSYRRISSKVTPDNTLWFGYSESTKGWLSAVTTANSWNGELMTPGSLSHRIYAAQMAVVTSSNPANMICADIVDRALRQSAPGEERPLVLDRMSVTETELSNLNISSVAVLYDQDTEDDVTLLLNAAGSSASPEATIRDSVMASLEYCNAFLYISEVDNFYWEFTAVGKIPAYDRTGQTTMDRDLDTISTTQSNAGIFARQFFTTNHADQGVLIVGGERDEDGLGEIPGNYSVVAWYRNEYLAYIFAHEMAHNLGCRHDRASYNDPLGNGLYAYGYTYELDYDADGTVESYGTIMSYGGDYLSPYFSNPEVDDEGVPTGVPLDQPAAANNALKLREQASAITGFRLHPEDAAITTHPSSNSVSVGQTLTVTVAATGPNLRYQWYKDNQAIVGATTSTYTKTNVTRDDAGSYFAAVSNPRRTAISNTVTIPVSSSPPPSTGGGSSSGGGSGGGGGGGAPSYWFITALALLTLRRIRRYC